MMRGFYLRRRVGPASASRPTAGTNLTASAGPPQCGGPARVVARPHLREIVQTSLPHLVAPFSAGKPLLLVNARLAGSKSNYDALAKLVADAHPGVVRVGDDVAAVLLSAGSPLPPAAL